jgi:hypothetical protein
VVAVAARVNLAALVVRQLTGAGRAPPHLHQAETARQTEAVEVAALGTTISEEAVVLVLLFFEFQ